MGVFGQTLAQLRQIWGRLGRPQQIMLVAGGGVAIVFAVFMMQMGGGTTYVTAFTNLEPRDANAITEQLTALGIPYQISADSSTVKIPPANLADARMKLAAQGLPQGGAVGFELFDKTSFGVTDFAQHVNYKRALEGELQRTITSMSQVEQARVHIVVPEQELFVSQQKPATASVVLRLKPGNPLDDNQLRGIAHMIARSVEGLETKNITVLDDSGRMLYDGDQVSGSGAGLTATQLDTQRRIEKDIENQLQSLLDQVAGAGRSVVRVRADLDFDAQEAVSETYTPGGANNQGVPRSSSTVQENFSGAGAGNLQPGAAVNVPGVNTAANGANGANSQYQRTETTTNFEVSKSTQKTVKSPGAIKRLNVSLLLDSSIPEADAAGLRDVIAAAAGFDEKRGDQLAIATAAFSGNGDLTGASDDGGATNPLLKYATLGVPLIAALVVLFLVWRMSRSVTPKRPRAKVLSRQSALPPGPDAATDAAENQIGAPAGFSLGGMTPADTLTAGEGVVLELSGAAAGATPEQIKRRNETLERMITLARTNPDAVAEIIQSWLSKDDGRRK